MAGIGPSRAVPLEARRCTRCGRGVADGARFTRSRRGGPNSYRPRCTDCEKARIDAAREVEGYDYGRESWRRRTGRGLADPDA